MRVFNPITGASSLMREAPKFMVGPDVHYTNSVSGYDDEPGHFGSVKCGNLQSVLTAVNAACGLLLAAFGYVWDASMGTVIMWVGIVWGFLAGMAYSSERVTEFGEILTYRAGKKDRSMRRDEVTKLVLRLKRRPRRSQKQSVLPWSVEIWGGDPKPFASYDFQEEASARAFTARLAEMLSVTPTELVEREASMAA